MLNYLGDNYSFLFFDITVERCGQTACTKCISKQIIDCSECDEDYILNRKTGECVPVLTIYSLGSIKLFGMILFFLLLCIALPILNILKCLNKTERSVEPIYSIVVMVQSLLLITHFDMNPSEEWTNFTDGFQYFKFNLRFLNPIFNLRSKLQGHQGNIPSRMYGLLLEDNSAATCFINMLIILILVITIKLGLILVRKIVNRRKKLKDIELQDGKSSVMIKMFYLNDNKVCLQYLEFTIQYFMLCTISEVVYTFNWVTPISLAILIALISIRYIFIYKECKLEEWKTKMKYFCIAIFYDSKRLILCILFFIDNLWYLLMLLPLFIQMILASIVFFRKIDSKFDKIILILNESFIIVFLLISITTFNTSPAFVNDDTPRSVIGSAIEFALIGLLTVEAGFIIYYTFKDLIFCIKSLKQNKKVAPLEDLSQSQNIDVSNQIRIIEAELKEISIQKDIAPSNDMESSIYNAFSNKTAKINRNSRRKFSDSRRVEDSKYHFGEVSEDDIIIERIGVVEYNSNFDNSKSKTKNNHQYYPSCKQIEINYDLLLQPTQNKRISVQHKIDLKLHQKELKPKSKLNF